MEEVGGRRRVRPAEEVFDDNEGGAVLPLLVVGAGKADLERQVVGEASEGGAVLLLSLVEPAKPGEGLGEVGAERQVVGRAIEGGAEAGQWVRGENRFTVGRGRVSVFVGRSEVTESCDLLESRPSTEFHGIPWKLHNSREFHAMELARCNAGR